MSLWVLCADWLLGHFAHNRAGVGALNWWCVGLSLLASLPLPAWLLVRYVWQLRETKQRSLEKEAHLRLAQEFKQLAEAREAENKWLLALFDGARDAIFLSDPATGIILDANEQATRLLNRPKKEIIGRHQTEIHPPDQAGHYRDLFNQHVQTAPEALVEAEVMRSDGQLVPVEISASVIELPGRRRVFQGIFRDISRRKEVLEQLRTLSTAVEQSSASIVITNVQGDIEYVNPKFAQLTGYAPEEVVGKNPRILKSGHTPAEAYQKLWSDITQGRAWRGEFQNKKKDGGLYWETAFISPIRDEQGKITHFLAIKDDITEKKRLEQQFLRAQRMDCLGAIAAGVAHDLNNILAPILMSVDLLRSSPGAMAEKDFLELLHTSATRGTEVVRQLLIFGRGLEVRRSHVQVRTLLLEMARLIQETFPKTITVETSLPRDLWLISADPTQIHQVLLNLCVNARDAMAHGGVLTITAENQIVDETAAAEAPDARPGKFVRLTVTDTGTGMAPETLDKIFEPFFTTKEPGKGTGLGLATALGIVKGHEGFLQVHSRRGEGTRFEIYLPAMAGSEAPEADKALARPPPPKAHGEVILLVEDEDAMRAVGRQMLISNGYRVLTARNGAEGILKYSRHRNDILAVVTDLVMPVMDGAAFIRALRELSPRTRIIAMSGLAPEAAPDQPQADAFITKPFETEELIQTLQQVLNSPERGDFGAERRGLD